MLNYEAVLPALIGGGLIENRMVEAKLLPARWCSAALAGLALGASQIWLFTAAMLAGMGLQRLYADMRDGPVNHTKEKFS